MPVSKRDKTHTVLVTSNSGMRLTLRHTLIDPHCDCIPMPDLHVASRGDLEAYGRELTAVLYDEASNFDNVNKDWIAAREQCTHYSDKMWRALHSALKAWRDLVNAAADLGAARQPILSIAERQSTLVAALSRLESRPEN